MKEGELYVSESNKASGEIEEFAWRAAGSRDDGIHDAGRHGVEL
jgi:hypothetical protein